MNTITIRIGLDGVFQEIFLSRKVNAPVYRAANDFFDYVST